MNQTHCKQLELADYQSYLSRRPLDAHKGLFGHVVVVGGDFGFSGAVMLAAHAALRVGAGKVSIATRPEQAMGLNLTCPELMCHGIASSKYLRILLQKAQVILIGPGLGQSSWSKKLLAVVLKSKKPLVVDADALNLLAKKSLKRVNWVLTPHPGEAARLLHTTTEGVQEDRVSAVKKLHQTYKGVCVLKGKHTLVLGTDNVLTVCTAGNPGMATAGTGDVLSGVIAGLIAQGLPVTSAAQLGVLVHGLAGDLAAVGGERGMMASDLLPYLRQLVNPRVEK